MLDQNDKKIITTLAKAKGVDPETIRAALALLDGEDAHKGQRASILVCQAEAARLASVSRFTIRKMVAAGKLRPVELLPDLVRYRVDELNDL